MRLVSMSLAAVLVVVAAAPARAQWGQTASLYTQDGVEVTVDPRVFSLFALMNALGYDEETERGPPPLRLPKYSKPRATLRANLGRVGSAAKAFAAVAEKNPKPVEAYVRAALELGPAPRFEAPKDASPLAKAIAGPIQDWFGDEGGANTLRTAASEAKDEQKQTADAVDKVVHPLTGLVRLGDAQEQLLDDAQGAEGRVVVVLNPLDAHGGLLRATYGGTTYVVVGPSRGKQDLEARAAAAGVAFARTLVGGEARKAAAKPGTVGDLHAQLDDARKAKLQDGGAYAAELLACALVRHVKAGAACAASPVDGDPALAEIEKRVQVYAGEKTLLGEAAPTLLAALPAPPPPAPPVEEKPAKKGKSK